VKPQEGEDLFADLARGLAVVVQIEGVRARRVVDERHGEIAREGPGDQQVKRVVQARELLPASPDEEQRYVRWEIVDGRTSRFFAISWICSSRSLMASSFRLLVAGCWLLVAGCWSLAVGRGNTSRKMQKPPGRSAATASFSERLYDFW
jgi:hypothetical protein